MLINTDIVRQKRNLGSLTPGASYGLWDVKKKIIIIVL